MVTGRAELEARCRQAIEELHVFFAAWLSGTLPDTDAAFASLESALAPDFSFVRPDGRGLDRATLLVALRAGNGGQPGLSIRIDNVRLLHTGRDLWVAEYEEWQRFGEQGEERGRRSTVVFELQDGSGSETSAEASLIWRRVHETWIERG